MARSSRQSRRIRTYLLDPSELSRRGWQELLRGTPFELAGGAGTLAALENDLRQGARPELLLVDVPADGTDISETVAALGEVAPESKIVVLSLEDRPRVLVAAFTAGAHAYLSKDISLETLLECMHLVSLGEKVFPTELISSLMGREGKGPRITANHGLLSHRERQVLDCLVAGLSNKMIARELEITETTVKLHVKNILRKIDAKNRTQAAIWAIGHGLADGKTPGEDERQGPVPDSDGRRES